MPLNFLFFILFLDYFVLYFHVLEMILRIEFELWYFFNGLSAFRYLQLDSPTFHRWAKSTYMYCLWFTENRLWFGSEVNVCVLSFLSLFLIYSLFCWALQTFLLMICKIVCENKISNSGDGNLSAIFRSLWLCFMKKQVHQKPLSFFVSFLEFNFGCTK